MNVRRHLKTVVADGSAAAERPVATGDAGAPGAAEHGRLADVAAVRALPATVSRAAPDDVPAESAMSADARMAAAHADTPAGPDAPADDAPPAAPAGRDVHVDDAAFAGLTDPAESAESAESAGTDGTAGTAGLVDDDGPATPSDSSDPADPGDAAVPDRPGTRRGRWRVLGWVALALAAVFCVLAAGRYWQACTSESLAYGRARDAAVVQGRAALDRLNTVDAAQPEASLRGWLEATTGPLHDQLQRTGDADAATLRQAGTSARGSVTDAALTELDTRAGTARLIATVTVELSPRTGSPSTDRKRFEAGLARTADGWKVTSLTAVPVGAS